MGAQAQLKPRVVILTDIGQPDLEPDDTESLVHLLCYADQLEIEGVITSTGWNCDPYPTKSAAYRDSVVEAYGADVHNNILANNTDDHNKNFTFIMDRQGTWRLSPAYDMTYIFDTGGYLPNKDHCLMIGGKLQGITRDDAIQFARDNGIRRPDAIIRDVVASLKQFRTIATKYSVSEQWTGRVETIIIDHLKAWGEWDDE